MSSLQSHIRKLLMLGVFLLVGFMAINPFTPVTEAAVKGCRSDPLVVLSDGAILDVTAEIGTDVANVLEIHYTVHGPRGVQLVYVLTTPMPGFQGKETFTYIADGKSRTYTTETLVHTINSNVPVISHTTFAQASAIKNTDITVIYKPIEGFNNQILSYTIRN
jgi:hypothetical protein